MALCMLLLLAVQCAAATHVRMGPLENFSLNVEIFRFVNGHHTPAVDWLFTKLAPLYYVIPVLAIILLAWRRTPKVLLAAIFAIALETIFVHLLKHSFNQPRPGAALDGVHLLVHRFQGSFPSGDVAMVLAAVTSLTRFARRRVLVLLYAYGALIAYERMYVGVHFPLDVLAGAVIGFVCGYFAGVWTARSQKPAGQIDKT